MYSIPVDKIYQKINVSTGIPVSELKDKVQAKLQQLSGLISEEGAAHIIANELGVKIFETPGLVKISDLLAGMRNIDIQGKVIKKYEKREFATKDGRQGKVANLLLGDETGVTRLVLWNSQVTVFDEIADGTIIKVSNATVKDNNNRAEVHANDNTAITINPVGVTITIRARAEETMDAVRKYIQDLKAGDMNVALLGTIVQVFDIKFFEVCPQCQKRVRQADPEQKFICQTHGAVTPAINYVVSLILDDGTGTIRVTCWRQQTQQLIKKQHEEIILAREAPTMFDDAKMHLLGTIVKIAGRVQQNATFDRIEFTASNVDTAPNPEQELKVLMDSHLSPKAPTPDLNMKPATKSFTPASEEGKPAKEEYFEEDV